MTHSFIGYPQTGSNFEPDCRRELQSKTVEETSESACTPIHNFLFDRDIVDRMWVFEAAGIHMTENNEKNTENMENTETVPENILAVTRNTENGTENNNTVTENDENVTENTEDVGINVKQKPTTTEPVNTQIKQGISRSPLKKSLRIASRGLFDSPSPDHFADNLDGSPRSMPRAVRGKGHYLPFGIEAIPQLVDPVDAVTKFIHERPSNTTSSSDSLSIEDSDGSLDDYCTNNRTRARAKAKANNGKPKRRPGRPRGPPKIVTVEYDVDGNVLPKRGRGRPRKPIDPNAPILPKRSRGRPRKIRNITSWRPEFPAGAPSLTSSPEGSMDEHNKSRNDEEEG